MKKIFLIAGALILLGAGCAAPSPQSGKLLHSNNTALNTKESDYNVIFISFDGLQNHHLYADGYPLDTTPNLDKFLAKSYYFKNTISAAPWTVPSHMSMFTSMFPSEHKLVNKFVSYEVEGTSTKAVKANLKQLSPSAVTLAEILKRHGFATAGFTGDAGVSAVFGYGQGFDTYYDQDAFGGFDTSTNKAEQWLEQNKDKKFFMFLHGYDVHGQHAPKEGFDYRFVKKPYTGKYTGSTKEQGALREQNLANKGLDLSDEDEAFWRAIYDEKINDADKQFGDFMTFLDQLDLTKKTIIVTVSDHGTEFFEHNGIDHGHTLYNELLNTLFAIHLPGQEQGKVVPSLVSSVDFAPTILSLLKISDPAAAQMKGMDLTRAFSGQDLSHDVYSETDYRLYTHKRSVQTPDGWKFILTMENRGRELYDLNTDPGEQTNLVEKETERAYELEQKLIAHLKQMNAADGPWTIGCLPVYMDQCQSLQSSNTATSTTESSKKKL